MVATDFQFRSPDRLHVWKSLALTMSQAATLTGVSERQIQHWIDKGYIRPSAGDSRKLNGVALDTVMLIRQARESGIPLRQAVALANAYQSKENDSVVSGDMARWALRDLETRLSEARRGIEALEQFVQESYPHDGHVPDGRLSGVRLDRVSSQRS